jgi:hypothetical protein
VALVSSARTVAAKSKGQRTQKMIRAQVRVFLLKDGARDDGRRRGMVRLSMIWRAYRYSLLFRFKTGYFLC